MCGIAGFWCRESTNINFEPLFRKAFLRGNDGCGVAIIYPNKGKVETYYQLEPNLEDLIREVSTKLEKDCIVMAHFRATPETEPSSTLENLQPYIEEKVVMTHNGGVADFQITEALPIDSVAIVKKYLENGRNLVKTLEELVGSWALAMYDFSRKQIILASSFLPLAHGYLKGAGYVWCSDIEGVLECLGYSRTGMNVWENYYADYLPGYSIVETDLDSGFQKWYSYNHRFIFVDRDIPEGKGSITLVCCSGGIDSSLTAWYLKNKGYNVDLVHFSYGQRGEEAELWCVKKLAELMGTKLHHFDLKGIIPQIGSLAGQEPVKTGGELIKTTSAWVPGRNAVFASIVMALAESLILEKGYNKIYISAGWAQLSEETCGYPDNSFQFSQALNLLKNFGYITGARIEFVPVFQRLTKTEEWILGAHYNFPFEYTCSCDNPKLDENGPILCTECGSTKLSIWASIRAGIKDPRRFYGPPVEPPKGLNLVKISVEEIEKRVILPE